MDCGLGTVAVDHAAVGRWSLLHGVAEQRTLKAGFDFRRPEYRREVFHRFYTFHLKYRAHPGAVYYVVPYLRRVFNWDDETALWWAFLNGNTQHPVTSTVLWQAFPTLATTAPKALHAFLSTHWKRLEFDADRRFWKVKLAAAVERYQAVLAGRTQVEFWSALCSRAPHENFADAWAAVRTGFLGFGRLSAWSYLEYLRVLGYPLDPPTLMLDDREGSRSHRNGLCKVLGRDDLDWHPESNPGFDGRYTSAQLAWLTAEAEMLLLEACERNAGQPWSRDVGFFTLESTLCCYKSWHRPNRRYPNVYNDMFCDRIRRAARLWGEALGDILDIFWEARRQALPAALRLEETPEDVGLAPQKQNHYRTTGEVILLDLDDPVFANHYHPRAQTLFDAETGQ